MTYFTLKTRRKWKRNSPFSSALQYKIAHRLDDGIINAKVMVTSELRFAFLLAFNIKYLIGFSNAKVIRSLGLHILQNKCIHLSDLPSRAYNILTYSASFDEMG